MLVGWVEYNTRTSSHSKGLNPTRNPLLSKKRRDKVGWVEYNTRTSSDTKGLNPTRDHLDNRGFAVLMTKLYLTKLVEEVGWNEGAKKSINSAFQPTND